MNKNLHVAVITVAAMMLLAMAGLAWACSPQSTIVIVPDAGPSARRALASGNLVNPQAGSVTSPESTRTAEVRWNSSSGPLLTTVEAGPSGDFSTEVTLPQAAPGVYYLVLTSAAKDVGRVAVQVTATGSSSSRSVASGLWTGFSATTDSTGALDASAGEQATGSNPGMLAGIGLTAFGITAAAMGLSLAALRKRKASEAEIHS